VGAEAGEVPLAHEASVAAALPHEQAAHMPPPEASLPPE
jgi:hypothetical protein